jgi:2-C-methyl-D-erythritol 4-phosphate cytidylyltransferase/2-C-methyl-D-erythritol 2,4-cyclodiphosphate synthase
MYVSAILAAGGRGHRFGGASPKQLLSIGGRSILERSLSAFLAHPAIDEIIVALPADIAADPPDYLRRAAKPLRVVAGGERRQDSVATAFRQVAEHADVVIVHDAARPFVTADLIERTIAAAAESGAALAAIQSRDTVKLAGPARGGLDGSNGPPEGGHYVRQTLDRETIFLAQTPQAFRRDVLREALLLDGEATDEAALAERAGHRVRLVEGDPSNIKITTPGDLMIAEAIARGGKPARTGRAGTGYDLHRLGAGRPLVLGGVTIPSDRGALGHSDADVVCHAITDAILGAVCLGDIGHHFPDSDPRWKGASSLDLLSRAAALVANEGYEVGNVDVTVILEQPRLRPYIVAMREAIAGSLDVGRSSVSIKAKTNEGVDAVGRGEAVAAHAVAILTIRN